MMAGEFAIALFAAIPSTLLVADFIWNRHVNGWLLFMWFVCMILAIAFTIVEGEGRKAGDENIEQ